MLAGQDLSGTLAIVTGGHSGLGLETTLALADAGARVIVACRAPAAAKAVLGQSAGVEIAELDLADLNSVRRFAADFTASSLRADIVINNAGVMACPEARVGHGWERQFATNHLGHYALTNLLWRPLPMAGGWSLSPPPGITIRRSAGKMCSSNAVMTSGWRTVSRRRRMPCSPSGWIFWAARGGSAHLACIRAASPRRCSGTYREQR
ncbi:SDR family NAD(P)-dependent oxidoreductase [Serratia marcescens]